MDKAFFKYILSGRRAALSNDALMIYLTLRGDIELNSTVTAKMSKFCNKLKSGFSAKCLCDITGLHENTVFREIISLTNVGWIRMDDGYLLGEIKDYNCSWFMEEAEKSLLFDKKEKERESALNLIRSSLLEKKMALRSKIADRRAISDDVKKKLAAETIGSLVREEKDSTKLLVEYKKKYKAAYGLTLPWSSRSDKNFTRMYAYLNRVIEWCDSDWRTANDIIGWTIENWLEIRKHLNMVGFPNVRVFATKSIFDRLVRWHGTGLPKLRKSDVDGVGKRVNDSEISAAKDVGW